MPKYPLERENRKFVDIVKDILQSAALEELAIAHLINAEAEKIQAFTGHYGGFPTSPTNKQINEFQENVARILEALTQKQQILVRTIEISKELLEDHLDDIGEQDEFE